MIARAALMLAVFATAHAVIGRRDWRKVDLDAAGKQLEDGDDPELLIDEDKLSMEEYDRRRKGGMRKPEDDVALKCVHARNPARVAPVARAHAPVAPVAPVARALASLSPRRALTRPVPLPARPPQRPVRVAAALAGHVGARDDVRVRARQPARRHALL